MVEKKQVRRSPVADKKRSKLRETKPEHFTMEPSRKGKEGKERNQGKEGKEGKERRREEGRKRLLRRREEAGKTVCAKRTLNAYVKGKKR